MANTQEVDGALRKKAGLIARALARVYPQPECELDFRNPFELLIATILSAQCTDRKVNAVTPALFARFPDSSTLASAKVAEVEGLIRSLGLFRNKAKNIIAAARTLEAEFGGEMPRTIGELVTLAGVGRKTANCVLVNAFGLPGIMADTHCIRLSNRLGLASGRDAVRIELRLKELISPAGQAAFSHRLILHGRRICHARKPDCPSCNLCKYCDYFQQLALI